MLRWLQTSAMALSVAALLSGCDPDGKRQCAWTLEPEPKLKGSTDPGFIPVCARNRKSMKQDCRLQATLSYARQVFNRKFRYVDLIVESPGIPRTITSIKFCDQKD